MNKHLFVIALVFPLLLNACAFGYQARGSFSDGPGELRGKGYPGSAGGGRFVVSDPAGRLSCEGLAYPPSRSSSPGDCIGESGEGVVRCTDGREFAIRWAAISCRSWQGSGVDVKGNRLDFQVERR